MGVWNLNGPYLAKAPTTVLSESFDTFTGWVTVGTGAVSQSSAQAYEGAYSALKSTSGDPNGAYKLLSEPVQRNFVLSAWIYSVDPREGFGADRISIVDASGDGYGYGDNTGVTGVEVRNDYVGSSILGTAASWTRPSNAWYKIVMTARSDNTFDVETYDNTESLLAAYSSPVDSTHTGSFDRVAILGGSSYHVDNLVVKRFD